MSNVPAIEVEQLREMLNGSPKPVIVDVREKWEHDLCEIPSSTLIPLGELPQRLAELPRDQPLVLHCHHGGRSARATAFLQAQGFNNAVNLSGGIHAWSERIDSSVKTYQ